MIGRRPLRRDRTPELRELLSKIILHDTRPDWVAWARQTLALMPPPTTQPDATGL